VIEKFKSANEMLAHLIPADAPQVGPIIPTIAGSVVVNPGTGHCPGATEANAATNIVQLIKDAGLNPDVVGVERVPDEDEDAEGRFYFILSHDGHKCGIYMPGWELERVCWIDREDQNIWDFPRLYVNGSSWVWKFAMKITGEELRGEYDEDDDA